MESKTISMFMIKDRIIQMFRLMDELFWQPQESELCMKEYLYVRKRIKVIALTYILSLGSSYMGFILVPLLTEGENLVVEFYRPKHIPYIALYLFQCYIGLSHLIGGSFCFDIILYSTMMHTAAQLRILNKVIQGAFDIKIQTEEDLKKFKLLMRRCIEHHDFLLKYIKTIDERYASALGTFFITMFMCNVVDSYRFTTSTYLLATFRSFSYVVSSITLIFFMCYFIPAQSLQDEETQWYIKWHRKHSTQLGKSARAFILVNGTSTALSQNR
ncbi:unnamed protein product [Acanthoscelides obtectus]|uniref:Uncharacterized protein n=1 Tax=Acanthoscelides obtectus TaxID=200917 RepID=A0A9P0L8Q3_ACAOB|nr:unnamed protein product [Acanthoscelides obtectus]CAK1626478.1 hypothetical protein AOBTE_LOCUS3869 [Acanthoscelides obtectus]